MNAIKVLVIGGSYFVGRRLVENFLADGHAVSVLNRGTHPVQGAEQLTADRDQPGQVEAALAGRTFDWVIDTSCYTTRQAQIALQSLQGRFSHLVHLSSSAVYVEDGSIPMPEDHPAGRSPQWGDYGQHKRDAERLLLEEVRVNRTPVTILRPPYIYGPGNNLEREQFFWSRLLRRRPILLPRGGDTPVQFLHIDDLYQCVRRVLLAPESSAGQVFNVADPQAVSFKALVAMLADVAGVEATIVPVPYTELGKKPRDFFPFRDYACVLDVRKAGQILAWKPLFDLHTGFRQTLATYSEPWLATRPIDTTVEDEILSSL